MSVALTFSDLPSTRQRNEARHIKLALFSGNYNCVRDGANQALNKLTEHLLKRSGFDVRVYSPVAPVPAFAPAGTLIPVPSVAIPGRPEYRFAGRLGARLCEDLRAFKPDIILVSAPDLLGRHAQKLGQRMGVPVVASLHTRFETYFSYYGLGLLKRWADRHLERFYGDADMILAPTEPLADEMKRAFGRDKVAIWSRGVDRSLFNPAARDESWRRSLGYREGEVVVMFFGRLVREKGLDAFAKTIARLREGGASIRPLIIGGGPEADSFAAALPNANFVGHLSGAELGRAVSSADILLNPSVTEAFGNVNLEAMAAGVAVVSADVPSARALIEHGCSGWLVSPSNTMGLADAIAELSLDTKLRRALASNAVRHAESYSWEGSLERVARILLKLCGRDVAVSGRAVQREAA